MPARLCGGGEHGSGRTRGEGGTRAETAASPAHNPPPLLQREIKGTSKLKSGAHQCAGLTLRQARNGVAPG